MIWLDVPFVRADCVAFVGDHAIIGVSRPRENRTFNGLALNERLEREGIGPLCYLAVVNLVTGDVPERVAPDDRYHRKDESDGEVLRRVPTASVDALLSHLGCVQTAEKSLICPCAEYAHTSRA